MAVSTVKRETLLGYPLIIVLLGPRDTILIDEILRAVNRNIMGYNEAMRVISTSPDNTEILCALGAEDELVGISKHCDYPEGIQDRKPVVSDFAQVDVDAVKALEPDVVFCSTYYQAGIIQALVENHIRVFVTQPQSLASVYDNIMMVAHLMGRFEEGRALVAEIKAAMVPHPPLGLKVFAEEWGNPIIVAAPWIHEMIRLAGGTPVLPEIHGHTHTNDRIVSAEQVVETQADVVILPWCGVHGKVPLQKVYDRPHWERLPAVKMQQVFPLEDSLFVRPGPRLVQGVAVLRELLQWCRSGAGSLS